MVQHNSRLSGMTPRYNIAPSPDVLAVVSDDGERALGGSPRQFLPSQDTAF